MAQHHCKMIIRQVGSRQCRPSLLFQHGRSAPAQRRTFSSCPALLEDNVLASRRAVKVVTKKSSSGQQDAQASSASRRSPQSYVVRKTELQKTSFENFEEGSWLHPADMLEYSQPDREASRDVEHEQASSIADSYAINQHTKNTTARYGADVEPHYQPHRLLTNPPRLEDVTLELLLASQSHMGHSTSLWNPANAKYIFGVREGIHIISLDVTASYLRRAAKVVSGVAERGGIILFVGTRAGQERGVVRAAELAGAYHIFERWTPGTITNSAQILSDCKLQVLDERDQSLRGFDEQLANLTALRPDLVVCLNPMENSVMLHECSLASIPTIGIIDTDADPTSVTYPIPANDDSMRCVHVIAGVLARAGEDGQTRRRQAAARGEITFAPSNKLTEPEIREDLEESEGQVVGNEIDDIVGSVMNGDTGQNVAPPNAV